MGIADLRGILMQKIKERRKEKRLHYELPVWFASDSSDVFVEGIMVDISSMGMAFICGPEQNCPPVGRELTMRFSIPRYGRDCSEMKEITRTGCVFRIDDLNDNRHRVAIKFNDPPFWNLPPQ
jgi:hypothetical protein